MIDWFTAMVSAPSAVVKMKKMEHKETSVRPFMDV
jgi:hypothetical protein